MEARTRDDFPHSVHEVENVFIEMPDGCQLAARLFLPDSADAQPVPAVLEYIPYRKRDFMRARDEPIHRYFAGFGYAAVRVDVRGTGDSDGVLADEYSAEELADGMALIEWIAAQPWCNGSVGLLGISWGGFNALQLAALQPPALKAVISLCASDDRYADDAHYMGGCLLNENIQWGAILMTYAALPPDPLCVGERWRDMWHARLENLCAFPARWLEHPWRDEYWRHGSVCENFAAIECPVYLVGGWADAYTNAIPRLLAGLEVPRKALVGPWAHVFPHNGVPGPAIGFLQEALRWWDQWLADKETGIMDEPMFRAWMQEAVAPQPQYAERPGRWIAEAQWPSPRIRNRTWFLNADGMSRDAASRAEHSLSSPATTGLRAGEWCAFGADGEMPLDQRTEDGRSLCFDSGALEEQLEIFGAPVVELTLTCDVPVAQLCVRLNDVAEDGTSLRVCYGLLNLTHRDSHAAPVALEPGRQYRVRVQLNDIAHAFAAGHQVRVAISTAYWPIAFPPPEVATLVVISGASSLQLPVRPPRVEDAALPEFAPPEAATGTQHEPLRPLPFRRSVELDLASNETIYTLSSDGGEFGGHSLARLEAIDIDLGYSIVKRHRIREDDPLSATTELSQKMRLRRTDWDIRIDSRVKVKAGKDVLHFEAEITASENDQTVSERTWAIDIPRQLF